MRRMRHPNRRWIPQIALVKQDQGNVMSDRANVESAAINLGYARITSPITGRAGIRQVDVGNFMSAGQTDGIVVVTQLQPMSVLFTVPEDNIADIMARLKTGAELEADAYDRSQTTKLATGRLSAVDSAVDPTTGTVKLRALFDNSDGVLFPAQFVNIRLLVNTLHNQIVVPTAQSNVARKVHSSMWPSRTKRSRCAPSFPALNRTTASRSPRASMLAKPW